LASSGLDTSAGVSGPHDFAVRIPHRSSMVRLASTASRPNVCDDGQRPSVWAGMALCRRDFGFGKTEFFFAGRAGQRGQISACAKLGHVNHPPESSNFVRACNGRVRKHRFDGGIRKARKRWRLNCSQNIQSAARSSQDFQYSWRSYVKLWAYYGTGEQYPREPREGGFVCTGCYRDLGFPCYRPSRTTGCNTRMRGQLRKGSAK
jgi:hypothetical protein